MSGQLAILSEVAWTIAPDVIDGERVFDDWLLHWGGLYVGPLSKRPWGLALELEPGFCIGNIPQPDDGHARISWSWCRTPSQVADDLRTAIMEKK